jgi:hypothetical protein
MPHSALRIIQAITHDSIHRRKEEKRFTWATRVKLAGGIQIFYGVALVYGDKR